MVPVMWPCIHWSWLVTLHSVHHVSPHPTPCTHLAYTPGASGWAHPAPQDTTPMRELWVWAGDRVTRGPPLSPCTREGGIPTQLPRLYLPDTRPCRAPRRRACWR